MSMVLRRLFNVERGFIAARRRSDPPMVIPPSVPPARSVARVPPNSISSCAAVPRRAAEAKPSPISTPLIAGTAMSSAARRPSSLRSQWTCDPNPGGNPKASTSTTPPSESPSACAASMAITIAAPVPGSRHLTGEESMRSRSAGEGRFESSGTAASPIRTTCDRISIPRAARSERATVATATRAAVSRALARSRTSRASSKSYLSIPTRSAWPGRGRVRARPPGSPSIGITCAHFWSYSEFLTMRATGLPSVRDPLTPARISSSSASIFIRGPRP